ncbi:AAA family ATPase [Paracoccus salsus]|uniref:AAA family ATPase n=1 Tax=Paracoccus salsus TaxID=2911061 RepID=UPI001F386B79|nr:AAA family ATPase [Paracoccus salsus]MCF3972769.1 AAA family ATPase [Paracoccus salsus]
MNSLGPQPGTVCPAFREIHDPAWMYPATGHRRALAALEAGIEARQPLLLLTGVAGSGKTLLLRVIEARHRDDLDLVHVDRDDTDPSDPVQRALGAFCRQGPDLPAATLEQRLRLRLSHSADPSRGVLLIVDDAHRLSDGALRQIADLGGLVSDGVSLMPVLLAGQPELLARLSLPPHDALQARLGTRCDLAPLTERETAGYVAHRFEIARCRCHSGVSPFAPGSLRIVHHWSGGVPGVVNRQVRQCLSQADSAGLPVIGAAFADTCLRPGGATPGALPVAPSRDGISDAGPGGESGPGDPGDPGGQGPSPPGPGDSGPAMAAFARDGGTGQGDLPMREVPTSFANRLPSPSRSPLRSALIVLPLVAVIALGAAWQLTTDAPAPALAPASSPVANGAAAPESDRIAALPATRAVPPVEPAPTPSPAEVADQALPDAPAPVMSHATVASALGVRRLPPVRTIESVPDPQALLDEALALGPAHLPAAALLYARAALRNSDWAAYFLGQAFETGDGVGIDLNRARAWYRAAAGIWGAQLRVKELSDAPVVRGLDSRPVPIMQAIFPNGDIEIHWRSAGGDSPVRFAVEYQLAGGGGGLQRAETDRSAMLLHGPVLRWRIVTLDVLGADAESTGWTWPAPPAR